MALAETPPDLSGMARPDFGPLLRRWRSVRGLSQMALAERAGLSPRHVSFLETGRSSPSRHSVSALAEALNVPLGDRNALLEAAGFARAFSEESLCGPALSFHRRLVQSILERHEPSFAVAIDRKWDVVLANAAADRVLERFFQADAVPGAPNLARLLFHPAGLRGCLTDPGHALRPFARRLERERGRHPFDEGLAALAAEIAAYGIPAGPEAPSGEPALVLDLSLDGVRMRLLGCVLAFDHARAPALEELRIETFFPADEETAERLAALAAS